VSAKTADSITVSGKTYTIDSNTTVTKESGASLGLAEINVGDKVCVQTTSSDSKQVSKLMVLDANGNVSANDTSASATGSHDRTYAREKMSEAEIKTHDSMCQGHHGTVTDKTDNTITIDGKTYALKINTPVNKQEEPLLPKIVKVGDRVCYETKEAADGSRQITRLIALDKATDDKARVREHESDSDVKVKTSPDKVQVETPNNKVEVK